MTGLQRLITSSVIWLRMNSFLSDQPGRAAHGQTGSLSMLGLTYGLRHDAFTETGV